MTTSDAHLAIIVGLEVEIVRKDIKNLHLGVYPPDGRIRVAAPSAISDAALQAAVAGKLSWIRRQQAGFRRQARDTEREYVTGETHWLAGRRYRLRVVPAAGRQRVVAVNKSTIELRCRPASTREHRRALMDRWYRGILAAQIAPMLDHWTEAIGGERPDVRIRRMKTKWGSYSRAGARVWLNVELAKKPIAALEYVLVHEMLHQQLRHHDGDFQAALDRLLPSWRLRREELGALPLAHESWVR